MLVVFLKCLLHPFKFNKISKDSLDRFRTCNSASNRVNIHTDFRRVHHLQKSGSISCTGQAYYGNRWHFPHIHLFLSCLAWRERQWCRMAVTGRGQGVCRWHRTSFSRTANTSIPRLFGRELTLILNPTTRDKSSRKFLVHTSMLFCNFVSTNRVTPLRLMTVVWSKTARIGWNQRNLNILGQGFSRWDTRIY